MRKLQIIDQLVGKKNYQLWDTLELPPGPQDAIVTTRIIPCFSRESQPKPSFVTGILGGGYTEGIHSDGSLNSHVVPYGMGLS